MNRIKLKILIAVLLLLGCSIPLLYTAYQVKLPEDNYITISMRGFGPDNRMILDLNARELRVYSPYSYNYFGLLLRRALTKEEVESIRLIFSSKEYIGLPAFNMKMAMDSEEIHIKSKVQGLGKNIGHIMPEDKTVRQIIDLYNEFNITRE